jgi:diadenosine tetraphosphatase ApaH/serine/threonine PP2A family protein phosphatase
LGTIKTVGLVPIVFLGDYVDRGDYSLEVMLLLLTLKCQYPDAIVLLRGNHEFSVTNANYGFKEELTTRYPDTDLWEQFNRLFSYLPLAAVLQDSFVLLHGGIGPQTRSLQTIRNIPLPILGEDADEVISQIVWSDPDATMGDFVASQRGRGCAFGFQVLKEFLREAGCTKMIRAHQCVAAGVEPFCHNLGITVFTSSNYSNEGNQGAFIYVETDGEVSVYQLEPLEDGVPPLDGALFEDEEQTPEKQTARGQPMGRVASLHCPKRRGSRASVEAAPSFRQLTALFSSAKKPGRRLSEGGVDGLPRISKVPSLSSKLPQLSTVPE